VSQDSSGSLPISESAFEAGGVLTPEVLLEHLKILAVEGLPWWLLPIRGGRLEAVNQGIGLSRGASRRWACPQPSNQMPATSPSWSAARELIVHEIEIAVKSPLSGRPALAPVRPRGKYRMMPVELGVVEKSFRPCGGTRRRGS